MSAHDAVAVPVPDSQPTVPSKKEERPRGNSSSLRGMSYAEGESALAPVQMLEGPPPGDVGTGDTPVDKPVDPGMTTEETNDQAGGDPTREKSEEEKVAETHQMTLENLELMILQLAGARNRVFKTRSSKRAANFAMEILYYLSSTDSQTITAAWNNVKADAAKAFGELIDAIGYKDVARKNPREARATLAAHSDLAGFANAVTKKNPYAAAMAVSIMSEADRSAFVAAHPGYDATLRATDKESLGLDAFFAKDKTLREGEEGFRKRQLEGQEAECKDSDDAAKNAQTEGGKKLIADVQAAMTAGQFVVALGLVGKHPSEGEARAAVRELDVNRQMSALLGGLTFDEKWNSHAPETRRLLALRSADLNLFDALALFPKLERKINRRGKVKGARMRGSQMTSEAAYNAFQFLKALPAAHRETFQTAHPELIEEMNAHLNGSMKEADDTNFVGAHGGDQETISALLVQLDDPKFWLESPVSKMTGTLKMILAAGHRADVGVKLHALEAGGNLAKVYLDAGRRGAVEATLGLTGDPNQIPKEGSPEEQAAAWVGCLKLEQKIDATDDKPKFRVFKALGALTHANKETRKEIKEEKKAKKEAEKNGEVVPETPERDKPSLLKQVLGRKGLQIENLAVDELEDMNTSSKGKEDFYGLDFKDVDRKGKEGAEKDRNRVDVDFNPYDGHLVFKAPTLELDSVRFPTGDLLIQTGPVVLQGLDLNVTWPTPGNPGQKQRVIATAQVVDARGIMITGPGVMASIGHFGAQQFDFRLEEQDVDYSDNPDADQILKIVAEQNPARNLINAYMSGRIDSASTELAEYLGGFPGGAQGGLQLAVKNVVVEGIQVGAGTYVDKAQVEGIALTYDTRPSVHCEARITQLATMIDDRKRELAGLPQGQLSETDLHKKQRLEAEIGKFGEESTKLQGEIPKWKEKEQLYQDIFELNRLLGADATKANNDERTKLMRERAASLGYQVPDGAALGDILRVVHTDLAHHAGATASVDGASVKGVEVDGAKVDEVNVKNVDVSGEGDALASSLDTKTIKRLGGDGAQSQSGGYVASQVNADVGEVEVKGVSISGGAPMAAMLVKTRDRYRALMKLTEKKAIEKTELEALETQWKVVLPDGRNYGEVAEAMASMWELHGADIQKDEKLLAEFKGYEKALSGQPLTVEAIRISGISIDSGTSEAEATTLDNKPMHATDAHSKVSIGEVGVDNVKAGETQVGNVTAIGISGEANVDLLSDPKGKMKPDGGELKVGVESVRAKDVKAGGTTVSEVGVEDVALDVKSGADGSSVTLDVGKVYTKGVGLEQGKKTAEDRKAALQQQIKDRQAKGEPYADLEQQLAAIEDGLAKYAQAYADQDVINGELKAIDQRIADAQKKVEAAKKEAAVIKHKNPKEAAKKDQVNIKKAEAEVAKLQTERATIEKRLAEPQGVIASFESTLGLQGEASLENIHVGVTGLPNLEEVMKAANGEDADLSGTFGLQLGLGPLTIPAIDYAAPQMRVALGGATMPRLTADASVTVEKVPAKDGVPASHRIKSVAIAKFSIPEISGTALKLVMGVEGEQIQIELPTVSLKGLSLEGVSLPGLDAEALKTATGKFELASVQASLSAKVGDSMKANGNLSLKGLHAEALASGKVNFGLGDLTLDKLGFKQVDTKEKKGGGTIVSQILSIGGKATKLGKVTVDGSYDRVSGELSTTVGLGELTLSGVNYDGGGTHLGVGYAAMKGVKATVAAKMKTGDTKEGESSLESLYLQKLHIDSLVGRNIDYLGKGQKRERFGDGSEKVTAIEQHISLGGGSLYGIDVGAMRLDGDATKTLSLSLGSGKVDALDLWMKENGKQVLSAKASAKVEGVSVTMVDDDLHLGIKSFTGGADVTVGSGDNQTSIGVKQVAVSNTNVDIADMGKSTQQTMATVDAVTAKELKFGMGVKGSGMNSTHALGGAQLRGIKFKDTAGRTTVDIASGSGALAAETKMVGASSGNYDPKDPNARKNDEFVVPMYKVEYDITALDKLNGNTKLLYPDGKTFLDMDIVNGALKLDTTDNIKQMWSSWWKDIKGEDLSSWGFDMDAWGKRIQAIRDIDNNAFWTLLLKGVELAFNKWGESLTGGWSNIAKSVVGLLNADPKTSLVKAEPLEFASFQDSLNKAMKEYVDEGIKSVLDYGMLYDIGRGEYGRAAGDAGLWLVEWFGESVGWDAADEWAEDKRAKYDAQREAELRKIVANFVGYITGGGVDMKLGSKDGHLAATKTPVAGGKKQALLSSLLDIDVAGGGSLKGGITASALGVLRDFHYADGGTQIDLQKLTFAADAKAQGNVGFDEKTSRFSQADMDIAAGTMVNFEGLHFEVDKTFDQVLPDGVTSVGDQQANHGNTGSQNGPVSDGNTVRYDAGQYSQMMQNGQDPVGPNYTTELGTVDNLKATGIGFISESWATEFKEKTIAAQNAEVFGNYAPQSPDQKKDQKKSQAVQ